MSFARRAQDIARRLQEEAAGQAAYLTSIHRLGLPRDSVAARNVPESRDRQADGLADLAALVADMAEGAEPAVTGLGKGLWLVTGLMVGPRENHVVGSIFTTSSAEEALGLLLTREQALHPGLRAEAFSAINCTACARDFVARNPE